MDGRALENAAREMAPVFIVGAARSGTSLVYRSIQSHPRFKPAGGINLVESDAANQLLGLFGPGDVAPGGLADFLLGIDALKAVAADVAPLARRRHVVRAAAGGRVQSLPVWKAAGERHVLRRYFLEGQKRRAAQRLAEKSPFALPWTPHLRSAFPNARLIYVLRHPLDVYGSYRRRYKVDPTKSAWAGIDVDSFCARWAQSTDLALRFAQDADFLVLSYEDFTSNTEAAVRQMLAHVGEPFDEACLLREQQPQHWAVEPLLHAPIAARGEDNWEKNVDRETAAQVERRLGSVMTAAGYSART